MTSKRTGWGLAFAALALLSSASIATAKDTLTLGLPIEPTGLDPTISAPVAIREVTWGRPSGFRAGSQSISGTRTMPGVK